MKMGLKVCNGPCPLARLGVPLLPLLLTVGICITSGLWCAVVPGAGMAAGPRGGDGFAGGIDRLLGPRPAAIDGARAPDCRQRG